VAAIRRRTGQAWDRAGPRQRLPDSHGAVATAGSQPPPVSVGRPRIGIHPLEHRRDCVPF